MNHVFSLHDTAELQRLIGSTGFRDVSIQADTKSLPLGPPEEFLWQYVHSNPLSGDVAQVNDELRASLERDVVAKWQELVKDGALMPQVRMLVAPARK